MQPTDRDRILGQRHAEALSRLGVAVRAAAPPPAGTWCRRCELLIRAHSMPRHDAVRCLRLASAMCAGIPPPRSW